MPRFILASASPARLAVLRRAGIEPEVIVSGVDESIADDLAPRDLAGELAVLKAAAVAGEAEQALVLGCDSVLEFEGQALGKPETPHVAKERWQAIRGRSGVLHTGHCLHDTSSNQILTHTASTVVHFAELSDEEIDAYVATGEPLWVAGAFTIDGLGGAFITHIEGDHHNVIGLSLPVLRNLVIELGHSWVGLWNRPVEG